MTLQEIFDKINSNYRQVEILASQIYMPVRNDIDSHYSKAEFYEGEIKYGVYHYAGNFKEAVWFYSQEINWLLESLIDEVFMTAFSTRNKLQDIFNYSLAWVVADVQSAVQIVSDEMWGMVDDVRVDTWDAINDLESYIHSEVTRMYERMDLLSVDVISWIDAAVGDLANTLVSQIEEVNTNLTARIDFMETWTQGMFQAIYDYVDIRNAEMTAYINEANSTLYVYINNRVKELDNYIGSVQNELNARITIEVNRLSDTIEVTRISLTEKINELVTETGWNFTFFELFTFRPELSLLRMLTRSKDTFDYWKPYWQAFFARIFDED